MRQPHTDVSLPLFLLPFPSLKINKIFKKKKKVRRGLSLNSGQWFHSFGENVSGRGTWAFRALGTVSSLTGVLTTRNLFYGIIVLSTALHVHATYFRNIPYI